MVDRHGRATQNTSQKSKTSSYDVREPYQIERTQALPTAFFGEAGARVSGHPYLHRPQSRSQEVVALLPIRAFSYRLTEAR